jgi:hypothetical protein
MEGEVKGTATIGEVRSVKRVEGEMEAIANHQIVL